MEIRLLSDHRQDLVAERTRAQNRLRWHLLELCPELERSLKRGSLEQSRSLDRIDRKLRGMPASARVRVAREQVHQIRTLTRQANTLKDELLVLLTAHRPQLLAETGCGTLTAAILIGRTAGTERFATDASFARQAGVAPIPASSGQRNQLRLDRGGDRQLNRALHIIAITRARYDPATKTYLARKEAEGKTKKGALRCLKRHLARRFHHILSIPAEPNQHHHRTPQPDTTIIGDAPMPMPCLSYKPATSNKPLTQERPCRQDLPFPAELTDEHRDYQQELHHWRTEETGYSHI
jgi:transposase